MLSSWELRVSTLIRVRSCRVSGRRMLRCDIFQWEQLHRFTSTFSTSENWIAWGIMDGYWERNWINPMTIKSSTAKLNSIYREFISLKYRYVRFIRAHLQVNNIADGIQWQLELSKSRWNVMRLCPNISNFKSLLYSTAYSMKTTTMFTNFRFYFCLFCQSI